MLSFCCSLVLFEISLNCTVAYTIKNKGKVTNLYLFFIQNLMTVIKFQFMCNFFTYILTILDIKEGISIFMISGYFQCLLVFYYYDNDRLDFIIFRNGY